MTKKNIREKSFFERVPHAITIVFSIILLVTVMTYILPAGTYERINLDGRNTVVPGSYKVIDSTPIGVLQMFKAIPLGFKSASEIIFIVLAGGIMFGFMEKSKAIENAIGTLIKKMGLKRKYLIVVIMTFTYGLLGVSVGLENNIALIPVAAVLSLALGGDLILAAGISVGAMTIGFGLSPINPYTIGTGHKIAELPMFSGAFLRISSLEYLLLGKSSLSGIDSLKTESIGFVSEVLTFFSSSIHPKILFSSDLSLSSVEWSFIFILASFATFLTVELSIDINKIAKQ